MAKAQWCGGYDAAQLLLDRCLRRDGSLFSESGDQLIWTCDLAEELEGRVGTPDESKDTFMEKLERQVDGLSRDALQLTAELLYVELLGESDTSGETKEKHVREVLALAPETTPIPDDLRAALHGGGVATYGAGKNFRDAYLRFLVRFVIAWKNHDPEEQERLAISPWDFRALVAGIETSTDAMQANALLHLLFPETFEYMISPSHRQKLVSTFAAGPGVNSADSEEEKMQVIRDVSSRALGRDVELYEEPFYGVWREVPSPQWRELLGWARRIYEWPGFDKAERNYKLHLAAKLKAARDADESEWLVLLKSAFTDGKNNLTDWRAHDAFLAWCNEHPDRARAAIGDLWDTADDLQSAVAGFLEAVPDDAIRGPGTRLKIASFLLLGANATGAPFFKTSVCRGFLKLVDRAPGESVEIEPQAMYRPADLAASLGVDPRTVRRFLRGHYPRDAEEKGQSWLLNTEQAQATVEYFGENASPDAALSMYASWLQTLEELRLRLLADGLEIRDLLDAQSIAYWLTVGPPEDWRDEDRQAFNLFREGADAERDPRGVRPSANVSLPPATAELAAKTHLPERWLQDKLDLLTEKQQVVFYGPPGTGKTFVALKLGEHLAAEGGETRLVQFHPSYAYEDFFEGYRPVGSEGGQVRFELLPGPLREMASEAASNPTKPYLLIIDEINRGNVAKVFGELYFLLEYRDRKIQLQYSRGEQFALPENLFVIGTMNTSDRSIALVDSALRRRFYFAGFLPTEEPIKSVLANWLEANGLQPEPASILEQLNEAIGDSDFSIGPSYFMTRTGVAPDVERVWTHAIKPLLEEHFYGTGRDIEAEFGPSALERRISEAADASSTEDEPNTDAAPA